MVAAKKLEAGAAIPPPLDESALTKDREDDPLAIQASAVDASGQQTEPPPSPPHCVMLTPDELVDFYKERSEAIGTKPSGVLIKALKILNTMKDRPEATIDLSGSYYGDRGFIAISATIKRASITHLDLRALSLSYEALGFLTTALMCHPTLCHIDVRDNPLSLQSAKRLLTLVKKNPIITTLLVDDRCPKAALLQQQCLANSNTYVSTSHCIACHADMVTLPEAVETDMLRAVLEPAVALSYVTRPMFRTVFYTLKLALQANDNVLFICSNSCIAHFVSEMMHCLRSYLPKDGLIADSDGTRVLKIATISRAHVDVKAMKPVVEPAADEWHRCSWCGVEGKPLQDPFRKIMNVILKHIQGRGAGKRVVLRPSVFARLVFLLESRGDSSFCSVKCARRMVRSGIHGGGGLHPLRPFSGDVGIREYFGNLPFCSFNGDFSISSSMLESMSLMAQGEEDTCCGFAVAMACSDIDSISMDPLFAFAAGRKIGGKNVSHWGVDLRDVCRAAVEYGSLPLEFSPFKSGETRRDWYADWEKWEALPNFNSLLRQSLAHRRQQYFAVTGPHDTLFENIRSVMWAFREAKRPIVCGMKWRVAWLASETGVLSPDARSGGFYVAVVIIGQKHMNGEPHLVLRCPFGNVVGDGGLFYASRVIVNREIRHGCFVFLDPQYARACRGLGQWVPRSVSWSPDIADAESLLCNTTLCLNFIIFLSDPCVRYSQPSLMDLYESLVKHYPNGESAFLLADAKGGPVGGIHATLSEQQLLAYLTFLYRHPFPLQQLFFWSRQVSNSILRWFLTSLKAVVGGGQTENLQQQNSDSPRGSLSGSQRRRITMCVQSPRRKSRSSKRQESMSPMSQAPKPPSIRPPPRAGSFARRRSSVSPEEKEAEEAKMTRERAVASHEQRKQEAAARADHEKEARLQVAQRLRRKSMAPDALVLGASVSVSTNSETFTGSQYSTDGAAGVEETVAEEIPYYFLSPFTTIAKPTDGSVYFFQGNTVCEYSPSPGITMREQTPITQVSAFVGFPFESGVDAGFVNPRNESTAFLFAGTAWIEWDLRANICLQGPHNVHSHNLFSDVVTALWKGEDDEGAQENDAAAEAEKRCVAACVVVSPTTLRFFRSGKSYVEATLADPSMETAFKITSVLSLSNTAYEDVPIPDIMTAVIDASTNGTFLFSSDGQFVAVQHGPENDAAALVEAWSTTFSATQKSSGEQSTDHQHVNLIRQPSATNEFRSPFRALPVSLHLCSTAGVAALSNALLVELPQSHITRVSRLTELRATVSGSDYVMPSSVDNTSDAADEQQQPQQRSYDFSGIITSIASNGSLRVADVDGVTLSKEPKRTTAAAAARRLSAATSEAISTISGGAAPPRLASMSANPSIVSVPGGGVDAPEWWLTFDFGAGFQHNLGYVQLICDKNSLARSACRVTVSQSNDGVCFNAVATSAVVTTCTGLWWEETHSARYWRLRFDGIEDDVQLWRVCWFEVEWAPQARTSAFTKKLPFSNERQVAVRAPRVLVEPQQLLDVTSVATVVETTDLPWQENHCLLDVPGTRTTICFVGTNFVEADLSATPDSDSQTPNYITLSMRRHPHFRHLGFPFTTVGFTAGYHSRRRGPVQLVVLISDDHFVELDLLTGKVARQGTGLIANLFHGKLPPELVTKKDDVSVLASPIIGAKNLDVPVSGTSQETARFAEFFLQDGRAFLWNIVQNVVESVHDYSALLAPFLLKTNSSSTSRTLYCATGNKFFAGDLVLELDDDRKRVVNSGAIQSSKVIAPLISSIGWGVAHTGYLLDFDLGPSCPLVVGASLSKKRGGISTEELVDVYYSDTGTNYSRCCTLTLPPYSKTADIHWPPNLCRSRGHRYWRLHCPHPQGPASLTSAGFLTFPSAPLPSGMFVADTLRKDGTIEFENPSELMGLCARRRQPSKGRQLVVSYSATGRPDDFQRLDTARVARDATCFWWAPIAPVRYWKIELDSRPIDANDWELHHYTGPSTITERCDHTSDIDRGVADRFSIFFSPTIAEIQLPYNREGYRLTLDCKMTPKAHIAITLNTLGQNETCVTEWAVEYSDDGRTWTAVSLLKTSAPRNSASWPSEGQHRFWSIVAVSQHGGGFPSICGVIYYEASRALFHKSAGGIKDSFSPYSSMSPTPLPAFAGLSAHSSSNQLLIPTPLPRIEHAPLEREETRAMVLSASSANLPVGLCCRTIVAANGEKMMIFRHKHNLWMQFVSVRITCSVTGRGVKLPASISVQHSEDECCEEWVTVAEVDTSAVTTLARDGQTQTLQGSWPHVGCQAAWCIVVGSEGHQFNITGVDFVSFHGFGYVPADERLLVPKLDNRAIGHPLKNSSDISSALTPRTASSQANIQASILKTVEAMEKVPREVVAEAAADTSVAIGKVSLLLTTLDGQQSITPEELVVSCSVDGESFVRAATFQLKTVNRWHSAAWCVTQGPYLSGRIWRVERVIVSDIRVTRTWRFDVRWFGISGQAEGLRQTPYLVSPIFDATCFPSIRPQNPRSSLQLPSEPTSRLEAVTKMLVSQQKLFLKGFQRFIKTHKQSGHGSAGIDVSKMLRAIFPQSTTNTAAEYLATLVPNLPVGDMKPVKGESTFPVWSAASEHPPFPKLDLKGQTTQPVIGLPNQLSCTVALRWGIHKPDMLNLTDFVPLNASDTNLAVICSVYASPKEWQPQATFPNCTQLFYDMTLTNSPFAVSFASRDLYLQSLQLPNGEVLSGGAAQPFITLRRGINVLYPNYNLLTGTTDQLAVLAALPTQSNTVVLAVFLPRLSSACATATFTVPLRQEGEDGQLYGSNIFGVPGLSAKQLHFSVFFDGSRYSVAFHGPGVLRLPGGDGTTYINVFITGSVETAQSKVTLRCVALTSDTNCRGPSPLEDSVTSDVVLDVESCFVEDTCTLLSAQLYGLVIIAPGAATAEAVESLTTASAANLVASPAAISFLAPPRLAVDLTVASDSTAKTSTMQIGMVRLNVTNVSLPHLVAMCNSVNNSTTEGTQLQLGTPQWLNNVPLEILSVTFEANDDHTLAGVGQLKCFGTEVTAIIHIAAGFLSIRGQYKEDLRIGALHCTGGGSIECQLSASNRSSPRLLVTGSIAHFGLRKGIRSTVVLSENGIACVVTSAADDPSLGGMKLELTEVVKPDSLPTFAPVDVRCKVTMEDCALFWGRVRGELQRMPVVMEITSHGVPLAARYISIDCTDCSILRPTIGVRIRGVLFGCSFDVTCMGKPASTELPRSVASYALEQCSDCIVFLIEKSRSRQHVGRTQQHSSKSADGNDAHGDVAERSLYAGSINFALGDASVEHVESVFVVPQTAAESESSDDEKVRVGEDGFFSSFDASRQNVTLPSIDVACGGGRPATEERAHAGGADSGKQRPATTSLPSVTPSSRWSVSDPS